MTAPSLAWVAADAVRPEAVNSHTNRVQKIQNPFTAWRRPEDLGNACGAGSDPICTEDLDGGLDCLRSRRGIVLVLLWVLDDLAIPDPTICPCPANDNGAIHSRPASRATRGQHGAIDYIIGGKAVTQKHHVFGVFQADATIPSLSERTADTEGPLEYFSTNRFSIPG